MALEGGVGAEVVPVASGVVVAFAPFVVAAAVFVVAPPAGGSFGRFCAATWEARRMDVSSKVKYETRSLAAVFILYYLSRLLLMKSSFIYRPAICTWMLHQISATTVAQKVVGIEIGNGCVL